MLKIKTYPIIFLFCTFCSIAIADDDDDDAKKPAATSTGQTTLTLTAKSQQISGLQTIKLKPALFHAETVAYGKVLAIQPLFELRQRYLMALTERDSVRAKAQQAQQQMERQQALYRDGITAKRNVEDQQAQLQTSQAQLKAAHYQNLAIREQAVLTWGTTLTTWALSDSKRLDALLSGEKKLLQITLASQQNNIMPKMIYVAASGKRENAAQAELISIAPQTDGSQGNSYFFQTKSNNLSIGMNITAWLPEQDEIATGVMIPKSALLWVMDQAFVYVKTDDTHFARRPLIHYTLSADGYFVSAGLAPEEELVTTGGQMLLSEELRGQIPDDD